MSACVGENLLGKSKELCTHFFWGGQGHSEVKYDLKCECCPLPAVCRLLEQERREHDDLKATWQMANDQFLESQRLLMMDLSSMEDVLTTEQQRQIGGQPPLKLVTGWIDRDLETLFPLINNMLYMNLMTSKWVLFME